MKVQHYKFIHVCMFEYNLSNQPLQISLSIIVWISLRQTGKRLHDKQLR